MASRRLIPSRALCVKSATLMGAGVPLVFLGLHDGAERKMGRAASGRYSCLGLV